jgi:hypothetical protein
VGMLNELQLGLRQWPGYSAVGKLSTVSTFTISRAY